MTSSCPYEFDLRYNSVAELKQNIWNSECGQAAEQCKSLELKSACEIFLFLRQHISSEWDSERKYIFFTRLLHLFDIINKKAKSVKSASADNNLKTITMQAQEVRCQMQSVLKELNKEYEMKSRTTPRVTSSTKLQPAPDKNKRPAPSSTKFPMHFPTVPKRPINAVVSKPSGSQKRNGKPTNSSNRSNKAEDSPRSSTSGHTNSPSSPNPLNDSTNMPIEYDAKTPEPNPPKLFGFPLIEARELIRLVSAKDGTARITSMILDLRINPTHLMLSEHNNLIVIQGFRELNEGVTYDGLKKKLDIENRVKMDEIFGTNYIVVVADGTDFRPINLVHEALYSYARHPPQAKFCILSGGFESWSFQYPHYVMEIKPEVRVERDITRLINDYQRQSLNIEYPDLDEKVNPRPAPSLPPIPSTDTKELDQFLSGDLGTAPEEVSPEAAVAPSPAEHRPPPRPPIKTGPTPKPSSSTNEPIKRMVSPKAHPTPTPKSASLEPEVEPKKEIVPDHRPPPLPPTSQTPAVPPLSAPVKPTVSSKPSHPTPVPIQKPTAPAIPPKYEKPLDRNIIPCVRRYDQIAVPSALAQMNIRIVDDVMSCLRKIAIGRDSNYDKRPTGLRNLGNSCYQNAVFQALVHTPGFSMMLRRKHVVNYFNRFNRRYNNDMGSVTGITLPFSAVMESLLSRQHVALDLTPFTPFFYEYVATTFLNGKQHDADEFLTSMLSAFQEDFNQVRGAESGGDRIEDSATMQEAVAKACKQYAESIISPLDAFFSSILVTVMECANPECGNKTYNIEVPIKLSLGDGHQTRCSIEDLCDAEFRREDIVRTCPKCGCKQGYRHPQLFAPPKILIIAAKRFMFGAKNNRIIDAPRTLDISPYCWKEGLPQPRKYELYAIVNHSGTLDCGHYTATVKVDDEFYRFDDQTVTPSNLPQDRQGALSYIFFYAASNIMHS